MAPDTSPRRVVIAVDVDEVLCKYSEGFFKWQAEKEGSEEPPPPPGICFKLACNKGNAAAREEFALSQAFVEIDCIPGAKQAMKRLRKAGARFQVVTSRPLSMKEATLKYLNKFYDGLIDEVHFSPSGHKGKICKEIGALVLIDDQARNIADAAKEDIPGVLLDLFGTYTWSQSATLPGVAVRKRTWDEVANYLMHRLSLNTAQREGSDVSSHDGPSKDKTHSRHSKHSNNSNNSNKKKHSNNSNNNNNNHDNDNSNDTNTTATASPVPTVLVPEPVKEQQNVAMAIATAGGEEKQNATTAIAAAGIEEGEKDINKSGQDGDGENAQEHPIFWSSTPEMPEIKANASLHLLLPTRIPHPPTADPSPQPPMLHVVENISETETNDEDGLPPTPPPEATATTTTAGAQVLYLSVFNNDGEEFRESEPLLSGYIWKKGKTKSLRLARLLAGTPLQGICWHKRYFQVGPGQTMAYWRTREARDSSPIGRVNLHDSTELMVKGKELLIDLDTVTHRWFHLRCPNADATRRWAEACQAAAGAGSALYEQYLAQKRSSFVTTTTEQSQTTNGPQSAEALLEALQSEQKSNA